eukprot:TRINITY_DN750_c0_g1_i1.p1 TRINITY_DN750_c0_g1~~TRINITY_DN750_c0_g1_i1.p1  ORF type:complete len:306 (+),score=85.80 TRINITY_DN750_c0_g1_i1:163-1080(+)
MSSQGTRVEDIEVGSGLPKRTEGSTGGSRPPYENPEEEAPKTCFQKYILPRFNKGFLSNLTTFVVFLIGLTLVLVADNAGDKHKYYVGPYILSFGLFGFAGGITNWLAVKMLFDKVPLLYGSGVIPRRFKEIREVVKNTIMKTFFDREYLEKYMRLKMGQIAASMNIDQKIQVMLESPVVDEIIDRKLEELNTRPEGMVLAMMGIAPEQLRPMIKPFILGMGSDVVPMFLNSMEPGSFMNIDRLRVELDDLMTTKLEELTPDKVKALLEEVMREHLGWLIVWGNVFGGFIGIVAQAAGFGSLSAT